MEPDPEFAMLRELIATPSKASTVTFQIWRRVLCLPLKLLAGGAWRQAKTVTI